MSQTIISINPSTNEILGKVESSPPDQINKTVSSANKAQPAWQASGLEERIKALRPLVSLIDTHKEELSELTSQEMGRPIALCESLNDYAVQQFNWNLDNAEKYLNSETTYEDDNLINQVIYEPRGVVACIMAWNFPILNFVFSATQALISGNTVIVKYSEEIPLFSKLLEKICAMANLPEGVLSFIIGDGKAGEHLVTQDIDLIIFTGSTQTGQHLRIKAAEKGIPAILEMGGSSPGIIFPDINPDEILKKVFAFRFDNSGQYCDNLKRLIVHSSIFDYCVEQLASIASTVKIGSPLDRKTYMGPLVAERQVIRLETQIKDALDKGARVIYGGKRPQSLKGAWYEPTILTNITKDMRVWTEEIFGPALPVVPFETYEEAITLANDTPYGLTGYIFTNDSKIAEKAVIDIKAGCLSINGRDYFRPQNPFGGYKSSGAGVENGKWGFHETCHIKTIARKKA